MNLNPFAIFSRPKVVQHFTPRFHAATKAEQRKADEQTRKRLYELAALKEALSDTARAAAIERAKTKLSVTDKREGRA